MNIYEARITILVTGPADGETEMTLEQFTDDVKEMVLKLDSVADKAINSNYDYFVDDAVIRQTA